MRLGRTSGRLAEKVKEAASEDLCSIWRRKIVFPSVGQRMCTGRKKLGRS
jgi:hypothetical protein